jgi:hypothetical protein
MPGLQRATGPACAMEPWLRPKPRRLRPQPPACPVVATATTRHFRQLKEN